MTDQAFNEIAEWARSNNMPATDQDKLSAYGLYKQATEGDVKGSKPWAVQMVKRAKYDAWEKNKGTTKEEAKEKYIKEVKRQQGVYGTGPW